MKGKNEECRSLWALLSCFNEDFSRTLTFPFCLPLCVGDITAVFRARYSGYQIITKRPYWLHSHYSLCQYEENCFYSSLVFFCFVFFFLLFFLVEGEGGGGYGLILCK